MTQTLDDDETETSPKTTKPGELALSVKTELENVQFKKPFSVVKKKIENMRKMKILDEDTYCQEIDKIIQRDFFPDIEKLKTQNAYLDAVKNNDAFGLQKIYAKYSLGNTPFTVQGSLRSTFETPLVGAYDSAISASPCHSVISNKSESGVNDKCKKQSLDTFFASHTSEDNVNFEEITQEQDRKLREKKPWLFLEDTELKKITGNLPLPNVEDKLKITDGSNVKLETWAYKDRNYAMFVPDGVEMSKNDKIEMSKKKQEVVYGNTNFISCPFDEEQSKEVISDIAYKQSRALEGKIGVDGKEITLETPKINGFGFVQTPSPMPGIDASPFMTWGQIEGTPFKLDGSDTPRSAVVSGPSFKIAEQPKRERLAYQLAEKVGEQYRDRRKKALEAAKRQLAMSSPNVSHSPLNRLSIMSPAAKKLASAHLWNMFNVDSSLRSSYTPKYTLTPHDNTPKEEATRVESRRKSLTPQFITRTPNTTASKQYKTQTNLVTNAAKPCYNKRLKASDFFT